MFAASLLLHQAIRNSIDMYRKAKLRTTQSAAFDYVHPPSIILTKVNLKAAKKDKFEETVPILFCAHGLPEVPYAEIVGSGRGVGSNAIFGVRSILGSPPCRGRVFVFSTLFPLMLIFSP